MPAKHVDQRAQVHPYEALPVRRTQLGCGEASAPNRTHSVGDVHRAGGSRNPNYTKRLGSPLDQRHAHGGLHEATLMGVRWLSIARLIAETTAIASTLTLARMISPAEFGRAAVALIIVSLAAILGPAGLTASLDQSKNVDREYLESATFLSLAVGAALTMATIALDPVTSALLGDATADLVRLAAPAWLITGAGATSQAMLQRSLRFRRIALRGFCVRHRWGEHRRSFRAPRIRRRGGCGRRRGRVAGRDPPGRYRITSSPPRPTRRGVVQIRWFRDARHAVVARVCLLSQCRLSDPRGSHVSGECRLLLARVPVGRRVPGKDQSDHAPNLVSGLLTDRDARGAASSPHADRPRARERPGAATRCSRRGRAGRHPVALRPTMGACGRSRPDPRGGGHRRRSWSPAQGRCWSPSGAPGFCSRGTSPSSHSMPR